MLVCEWLRAAPLLLSHFAKLVVIFRGMLVCNSGNSVKASTDLDTFHPYRVLLAATLRLITRHTHIDTHKHTAPVVGKYQVRCVSTHTTPTMMP